MVGCSVPEQPQRRDKERLHCKGGVDRGEEGTIMRIWDAATRFHVDFVGGGSYLTVDKFKYDRDGAWTRMLQISKMTEEEFEAEWRKENGEDRESEDGGAEKKGQGWGRR